MNLNYAEWKKLEFLKSTDYSIYNVLEHAD